MSIVTLHKQRLLHGVSPDTLLIGCAFSRYAVRASSAWVFLLWLRVFLDWLSGDKYSAAKTPILEPLITNRHDRRMARRKIPSVRCWSILFHLCGRGVSRRQFMERMCAISVLGRVRIYRLRSWGNVLVRRARLICYDHGWWRAPIGDFGRLYCGIWPLYAWKDRYM